MSNAEHLANVMVEAFIAAVERGGAKFWELVPTAGKKNLADAPILKCLEE